jgi:hypothetical protein
MNNEFKFVQKTYNRTELIRLPTRDHEKIIIQAAKAILRRTV